MNPTMKPVIVLPGLVSGREPLRQVRRRRLHRAAHERHGRGQRHQGRSRPRRISTLRVLRLLLLRVHGPLACLMMT